VAQRGDCALSADMTNQERELILEGMALGVLLARKSLRADMQPGWFGRLTKPLAETIKEATKNAASKELLEEQFVDRLARLDVEWVAGQDVLEAVLGALKARQERRDEEHRLRMKLGMMVAPRVSRGLQFADRTCDRGYQEEVK